MIAVTQEADEQFRVASGYGCCLAVALHASSH